MFKATIYIENNEGNTEKLSQSFEKVDDRDAWVINLMQNYEYTFLMVSGE